MKNVSYCIIAAFTFLCCNNKKSIDCDYSQMQNVNINYSKSSIKIPKICILQDTLMFDSKTLMNHQYGSLDSSLLLFIYVKEDDFPEGEKNFIFKTEMERKEIIFGTKRQRLLKDTAVLKNKIKIGFLKYLIEKVDGKYLSSSIFFLQDKKIYVVDFLERFENEGQIIHSLADCMVESLKVD